MSGSTSGWPGYNRTGQMFPPSTWESSVIGSLLGAKVDADEARRHHAENRVDLFQDDFSPQLLRKLSQQYEIENFAEIFKTLDVSNNVCKKIITAVSTIYDDPPSWRIKGDSQKAWATLRKRSNLNLVMPIVNQYTNLCNECIVRVAVIRGRVRYHVITPDLVRVWQNPDDPTTIDAIAYLQAMVNSPGKLPVWQYWSNGGPGAPIEFGTGPRHLILSMRDQILKTLDMPYVDEDDEPIIPFITYHKSVPLSHYFDQTSGNDIIDGTLMVCVLESLLCHLVRVDAAAIKYVTGELAKEGSLGQVAGAMRMLTFRALDDRPINVGQFSSQADWTGLLNIYNHKIDTLCNNYGLSRSAIQVEGTPQSGFSLKVRKEPLLEIRKRQIPIYEATDHELYRVTAAVWNYERTNSPDGTELGAASSGLPLVPPSKAELEITYGDLAEPMTSAEKEVEIELRQVKLSMGLISAVDFMLEENPDMTEAEAKAAIVANLATNKEVLGGHSILILGRAQLLDLTADSAALVAAQVPPVAGSQTPSLPKPNNQPPPGAVNG